MPSFATDNSLAVSEGATPGSSVNQAPRALSSREVSRIDSAILESEPAWYQRREFFLSVLREEENLAELSLIEWDLLIRLARQTGMLSRLAVELRTRGFWPTIPPEALPTLQSALVLAERHERIMKWEFNRLEYALRELPGPLVLLKGAAYLAADVPISQGRIFSDVDLLVAQQQLSDVESKLLAHGWRVGAIDPRDASYFREWLHELPPFVHRRRHSMLDLHHNILPRTDKLQVDPGKLISSAVEAPGRKLRVLSPADMVLHSAAHLFRNGDFSHAVRDLYDLNGLIRHFAVQPDFWKVLIERTETHQLQWPCFCGLRYAAKYYHTPLSEEILSAMQRWQPGKWKLSWIDRLVDRALIPRDLDQVDRGREFAINMLAHWPVPRWQAMLTANFWVKRFPKFRRTPAAKSPEQQSVVQKDAAQQTLSQTTVRTPERPD